MCAAGTKYSSGAVVCAIKAEAAGDVCASDCHSCLRRRPLTPSAWPPPGARPELAVSTLYPPCSHTLKQQKSDTLKTHSLSLHIEQQYRRGL